MTHLCHFVKVQAASSGPKLYKGPIDVVKVLYKEGGIRSIYKGTCATLLRGAASVIFFSCFFQREGGSSGAQNGEKSPHPVSHPPTACFNLIPRNLGLEVRFFSLC